MARVRRTQLSREVIMALRGELVAATGLHEWDLAERAEAYTLDPKQRLAWETIQSLDFLLGND